MYLDSIALLDWKNHQSLYCDFGCRVNLQTLLSTGDVGVRESLAYSLLGSYVPVGHRLQGQLNHRDEPVIQLHQLTIVTDDRDHFTEVARDRISIVTLAKPQT